MLANSLSPNSANSLPKPDDLMPPKGNYGLEATILLILHIPNSSSF